MEKEIFMGTNFRELVLDCENRENFCLVKIFRYTLSKSTDMTKITVNHSFTMPVLTCVTMATCDKIWKKGGSNPGIYTDYGKNSCHINLGPIGYKEHFMVNGIIQMSPFAH